MNTVHLPDTDASPLQRLFEGEEPRTNLLELAAGEHVPDHRHPDRRILFYVIEGEITLRVGEETASLRSGDIARFDGDRDISPTADADSRALVVLVPRTDGATKGDDRFAWNAGSGRPPARRRATGVTVDD
jgi:quercetin dioxygenase-like cupin family protein